MDKILSLQNVNRINVNDSGCFLDGKMIKNSDLIKYLIGAVQSQQEEIKTIRRIWVKQ